MKLWKTEPRPVDRAIRELDKQRAAVDQQLRRLEHQQSQPHQPAGNGGGMITFIKEMLEPTKSGAPTSYRTQTDMFDGAGDVMKELDAQPIPLGKKAAHAELTAGNAHAPAPTVQQKEKLAHYLSAGSLRAPRSTKSTQRRDRNQFLGWLGLAVAALWVLYVVMR